MNIPNENSDLGPIIGRMSPKHVHILIPGTWGNVPLYDKRNLDVIKITDSKIGRLSWIL